MELTQLKYFCTAAECEHITKAAEKLHIAQPALTQSIKRLENELGVSLFERRGRSIVLSTSGEYLYKQLIPVIRTINRIPDEISRIAALEDKTIRVNILAASLLITELIIEYKKISPDVKFQLYQSVDEENCDCTVSSVHTGKALQLPHDCVAHTYTEEIRLAVPADSDYAKGSSVDLTDTKNDGFIILSGSKPFHSICDALCRTVGFAPEVIFESDSPSTVRDLIAAGMGIGFWPAFTWGDINTDNVLLLPVSYPECRREITLIRHNTDSSAANDFYRFLCDRLENISRKKTNMKI